MVPADLLPVEMLGFCIHLVDPVSPRSTWPASMPLGEFNGLGFAHGDKLNMCR